MIAAVLSALMAFFVGAWSTPRTWVPGELVTAGIMNSHVRDQFTILKTILNDSGHLNFVDAVEETISGGVITVSQNLVKVDTESDDATDDLNTITAGANVSAGFVVRLQLEDAARAVVLKDGTGNLDIGADVTLDDTHTTYALVYDGANWLPLLFTPAAFTFFTPVNKIDTSASIAGNSIGSYTTLDLGSEVPAGSKAAILQLYGQCISSDKTGFMAVRTTGSSDNPTCSAGSLNTLSSESLPKHFQYAVVKVDSSGDIDWALGNRHASTKTIHGEIWVIGRIE